jgi:uncharacterized membrane protein YjfL (UPF0719 family)
VNFVVSTAIITLIFAMIFKILPDVHIEWSDVWVGALATSLLFNIGKSLIGLYIGNSAVTSAYGAAGSLVVILLWVFFSAQILFLGAEFTQVYARKFGSRIQPTDNAVRLTETERAHQGMSRRVRPADRVQDIMVPVTAQPQIYAQSETPRVRVRYEPPDPSKVVPVIAMGTLAGIATLYRVTGKVIDTVSNRRRRAALTPSRRMETMREVTRTSRPALDSERANLTDKLKAMTQGSKRPTRVVAERKKVRVVKRDPRQS